MVKYEYIASRIRELRKERGLSAEELGAMVDRSGKTIEAYEAGTNQPNADMLIDLCYALEVDISAFVPDDQKKKVDYTYVDLGDDDERELLEAFRTLDERGRGDLLAIAKMMVERS